MNGLTLDVLNSIDRLRSEARAWDRLWLAGRATLPTARAELVAQWVERFAPGGRFRAIVVRQGERMVAALPLVDRRVGRLVPAGDLTWNYWSPNGELLLDPAADADRAAELLVEGVVRSPTRLLWLEMVPEQFEHWQTFFRALKRRRVALDVGRRYEIGQVVLDGQAEAYQAGRSKNLRRSLGKDLRRLEREGPVGLVVHSALVPDEVETPLRRAMEIEDRSWKGSAGTSVLQTPGLFEFYLRQARTLAAWRMLRLAFLTCGGRAIAFEFGWTAKGVYHSFKIGYDPEYRRFSPGQLLRWKRISAAFEAADEKVVDFQGPITPALAVWANRSYPVARVVVAPGSAGRILLAGYRGIRPLARRLRSAAAGLLG